MQYGFTEILQLIGSLGVFLNWHNQPIVFSFDEEEQLIYNYNVNQTQDYLTLAFS